MPVALTRETSFSNSNQTHLTRKSSFSKTPITLTPMPAFTHQEALLFETQSDPPPPGELQFSINSIQDPVCRSPGRAPWAGCRWCCAPLPHSSPLPSPPSGSPAMAVDGAGRQSMERGGGKWSGAARLAVSTRANSAAQHSTAQHSTAQRNTAQHSTAQRNTAQHSTAQHSGTKHKRAQQEHSAVRRRTATGQPQSINSAAQRSAASAAQHSAAQRTPSSAWQR